MPPIVRPLLLVAALLAGGTVDARGREDTRLPDSVRRVEQETGGKVLSAKPVRGERDVYRIKVLTPEGRVRVVHDDPARREGDSDRRHVPHGERD